MVCILFNPQKSKIGLTEALITFLKQPSETYSKPCQTSEMELFLKHRRFPVSFGKIFKNTFFTEHPRTTASENLVTVST